MMASIAAARGGAKVILLEKNEKLGKKLYITGKGRCNFTNVCGRDELLANVVSNPKFMYSAFSTFSSGDAVAFFEELGVKTKVERGRRAFPASDKSSDIIRALEHELKRLGVDIRLNTEVRAIIIEEGAAKGVCLSDNSELLCDAVIVATGALSYSSTGSTGDGYKFASRAGLKVTETRPALVPMEIKEDYAKRLQGLSLRNVKLSVKKGKKELYSEFGEMLFTHFGISGPLALSASSVVGRALEKENLTALIDLKPALSEEQLDGRLIREFSENKNKQFKNSLNSLFPAKLIPVMVEVSGIAPEAQLNSVSKGERREFAHLIKNFKLTLTSLRSYSEAIITQGGVSVCQIDPATMQAKSVNGLYFAGEVLDVDALTGGYNLQAAWSSGYLAGTASCNKPEADGE